jgi:hypothetical protein
MILRFNVMGWVKDGSIIPNKSSLKNNSLLECCSNLVSQSAMHNEIDLQKWLLRTFTFTCILCPKLKRKEKVWNDNSIFTLSSSSSSSFLVQSTNIIRSKYK